MANTIVYCSISIVVSIISFLLFKIDIKDNWQLSENKSNKIFLSMKIYSLIMIIIIFIISIIYGNKYQDNSIFYIIKKICLLSIMYPIGYIDYKTYRIPNKFIVFGILCRSIIFPFELIYSSENVWYIFLSEVISAFVLFITTFLCSLIIKNSIGFGDIKLFVIMGLFLGINSIWSAIFLSLIISFIISGYLLITKKVNRKDSVPFGPALVLGTFLSVLSF